MKTNCHSLRILLLLVLALILTWSCNNNKNRNTATARSGPLGGTHPTQRSHGEGLNIPCTKETTKEAVPATGKRSKNRKKAGSETAPSSAVKSGNYRTADPLAAASAGQIKPAQEKKSDSLELAAVVQSQAAVKPVAGQSAVTPGNKPQERPAPLYESKPAAPPAPKQKTEWDEIAEGILSSFSMPFSDLMKKKHKSEWDNLTDGLSISLSANIPLKKKEVPVAGSYNTQGMQFINPCFGVSLKYNPLSSWFINVTAYIYPMPSGQSSWNPDFTYVFGYDDWHPYTFSLIYSNYGGNRWVPDPSKNEQFTHFYEGTFTLGWKFPAAKFIDDLCKVHSTGGFSNSINYNLTPSYLDLASNSMKKWKQFLTFTTRYTIYKWIYLNFTLYYYFDPASRQPWNSDFTYGFGYFNWHPGTLSIQYNNYSGNRFPWNSKSPNTGTFLDGSISISWSWVF